MTDLNPYAAEVLEIGDLYSDTNTLRIAMNAIGIDQRERNCIISNGFTSMDEIVTHHSNDVKGFTDYLLNLNKLQGNRPPCLTGLMNLRDEWLH